MTDPPLSVTSRSTEVAWHYTTGDRWRQIRADGKLKRATALVPVEVRTVVWFTTADDYDPTATKAVMSRCGRFTLDLDVKGTEWMGDGLVRIGASLETASGTWIDYRRESGERPKMLRDLHERARQIGSDVYRWRLSWADVPREQWVAVELLDNCGWRPLSDDEDPRCRASTPMPDLVVRPGDPRLKSVSAAIDAFGDLLFRPDVMPPRTKPRR